MLERRGIQFSLSSWTVLWKIWLVMKDFSVPFSTLDLGLWLQAIWLQNNQESVDRNEETWSAAMVCVHGKSHRLWWICRILTRKLMGNMRAFSLRMKNQMLNTRRVWLFSLFFFSTFLVIFFFIPFVLSWIKIKQCCWTMWALIHASWWQMKVLDVCCN